MFLLKAKLDCSKINIISEVYNLNREVFRLFTPLMQDRVKQSCNISEANTRFPIQMSRRAADEGSLPSCSHFFSVWYLPP